MCHITTVHVRYDTRIFVKECRSIAKIGYDITLIVADGKGDEEADGVKILDIGKPSGRFRRIFGYQKKILNKAQSLEADIYHFHDPELLRIASGLMKKNNLVIYDAHEDIPRQLTNKSYIPRFVRAPLAKILELYEDRIISKISGVITVTPELLSRFLKNNTDVIELRNFPLVEEFDNIDKHYSKPKNYVCYVGAITKKRGILNIVDAMQYVEDVQLLLGGKFESENLKREVCSSEGWKNVVELGFLSRKEVKETLQKSIAGLVILEPTPSYMESIPVKMFEYMVAGIPVIASNFPYWRELIGSENCAIFVDPQNTREISDAIKLLLEDKTKANEMGAKGRKAVLNNFNWTNEEEKLWDFYSRLLNRRT